MFITKCISLAAVFVCLCASVAAQARPQNDPMRSAGHPTQDFRGADAQGAPTGPKHPSQDFRGADAQGAPTGPKHPSQDYRGADSRGAPTAPEGSVDIPSAPRVRVIEVPSPGIDWGDATVGAGGALVLVLLATATGMTVVRRRTVT